MSSFIGTPSGVGLGQWLRADDKRLMYDEYKLEPTVVWVSDDCIWAGHGRGYSNAYWPGRAGLDASGDEWHRGVSYRLPQYNSGAVSRYAFVGVTRNAYGSALGGVTVKLFKTVGGGSPDLKDVRIDEATSDVSGNYTVYTSYYPDTHYIVTYKSGTPDVQGTTVNTLIGA